MKPTASQQPYTELAINTDGGSRGNPGPAAIGVVVVDQNHNVVFEASKYLGTQTNNEAEYQAFLTSLEWLIAQCAGESPVVDKNTRVTWRLDSKLVVEQLLGNWKVKLPHLKVFVTSAQKHLRQLPCSYQILHVPREENTAADALVNQALDSVQ